MSPIQQTVTRLRRRQFLALIAAAIAAPSVTRAAVRPGTKVVVVGAGVSGLIAARELQAAGCIVTILEGRTRIGGRVVTDRARFGVPVELGAQFIHGVRNGSGTLNPLYDLAQTQRWATVPFTGNTGATYRNGSEMTTAQEDDWYALGDDFLDWLISDYKEQDSISVATSFDRAIAVYAAARRLTRQQVIDLRAYLAIEIGGDLGGDTSRISVDAFDEDDEFGVGGDHVFRDGYDQLPDYLAAGLDVRLNCTVRSITHTARPIRVVTTQGEFQADYVLITVPLGVLKRGSIVFRPILPTAKRVAIRRMGMGVLDKVILQFPNRFWPAGNWFTNIENAAPFGFSFTSQEASHPGSNILVAWQFGARAVRLEAASDAALVNAVMKEVRRTFVGIDVPAPTNTAVTRWSRDPFSRGSYSCPVIGSPRSDIATLAAPVNDLLYFAGEATHADYPSTVHGALLSGQREANAIIAKASA